MTQIKTGEVYTVNEIAESNILNTKHRLPTLQKGTATDIKKQLLLRDIRNGKLLAIKHGVGMYFIKGSDLLTYLTQYDKSNIVTKGDISNNKRKTK